MCLLSLRSMAVKKTSRFKGEVNLVSRQFDHPSKSSNWQFSKQLFGRNILGKVIFFFNSQNEYLRISNHSINRIRKKERKIKIAINSNEFEKCVSSIISNFYRAFNISMRSFYGGRAIRMFNLEQRGKIYYAKSLTERREAGMSKWK